MSFIDTPPLFPSWSTDRNSFVTCGSVLILLVDSVGSLVQSQMGNFEASMERLDALPSTRRFKFEKCVEAAGMRRVGWWARVIASTVTPSDTRLNLISG